MAGFEHPWLSGLLGDGELDAILSAERDLDRMRAVEMAYTTALGRAGRIAPNLAEATARVIRDAPVEVETLRAGCALDGLPVPALVKALRLAAADETQAAAIHTGLTSQDILDTGLVLALREALTVMETRLAGLEADLTALSDAHGAVSLMGRTRMQAALAVTVGDRVAAWLAPLAGYRDGLTALRPQLLRLQFGGPVGTHGLPGTEAEAVKREMGAILDLPVPDRAWHSDRSALAALAAWLSGVSGSLGKIGQDIALMAQQGLDEVQVAGGGSSSAMPHKANPVLAELLVSLARYNAGQLGLMHGTLVHEQERSGTAWTLEMMVLPDMLRATARGLAASRALMARIERIGDPS